MFHYKFGKENRREGATIWEKDPSRTLQILNASGYKGELGLNKCSFWQNIDRVYIVNGHCNKADGNFMDKFHFNEISDTGIVLGSYPFFETDVQQL